MKRSAFQRKPSTMQDCITSHGESKKMYLCEILKTKRKKTQRNNTNKNKVSLNQEILSVIVRCNCNIEAQGHEKYQEITAA